MPAAEPAHELRFLPASPGPRPRPRRRLRPAWRPSCCWRACGSKSPSADRIVDQRSGCSGVWASRPRISREPVSGLSVIGKSSPGLRLDQPRPPSQHVSQMVWHREHTSLPRCSISLPPQTGHEGGHDSRVCSCFGEAGVFGESMVAPLAGTAGSRAATTIGEMFVILKSSRE